MTPEEKPGRTKASDQAETEPDGNSAMRAEAQRRAEAVLQEKRKRAKTKHDPFLRAANEDDDGYDPYSDRVVRESPYEEDPWR